MRKVDIANAPQRSCVSPQPMPMPLCGCQYPNDLCGCALPLPTVSSIVPMTDTKAACMLTHESPFEACSRGKCRHACSCSLHPAGPIRCMQVQCMSSPGYASAASLPSARLSYPLEVLCERSSSSSFSFWFSFAAQAVPQWSLHKLCWQQVLQRLDVLPC